MNNIFLGDKDTSMYQYYQQFMQQNQPMDYYKNLENELQSLSNDEINELLNFKPYIESNNALSMLVQAEVLNLVRGKINSNPEVINNVINSIKEFKNIKKKEEDNFKDYIKNYSELSYKEYLELKNSNK